MKIKNPIWRWLVGLGILLIMIVIAMVICGGIGFIVRNFFPFIFKGIGFWGNMGNGIATLGIIALAVIIGGFMYIGAGLIGNVFDKKCISR